MSLSPFPVSYLFAIERTISLIVTAGPPVGQSITKDKEGKYAHGTSKKRPRGRGTRTQTETRAADAVFSANSERTS